MENSGNKEVDSKLKISFPKSKEDHRLQLVEINGSIFAIFHAPLESQGPIHLFCENWSLVLLAPIKSKTNIVISAINVICLSEIVSEEGNVTIHASNQLVKFANLVQSSANLCERGERGDFQFEDDPGAFLYYYRLCESIVDRIHEANSDSFSEAQKKLLTCLCALADKVKSKPENLDLHQVLAMWNISSIPRD